jgi:hypothetical protein
MPDPLHRLAREVEGDPFFLAGLLADFARSEDMTDEMLAAHLGCPLDELPRLKLCRAPRQDRSGFREDIDRLTEHFHLDPQALVEAVLRGQVAQDLRQAETLLMAARDRDREKPS